MKTTYRKLAAIVLVTTIIISTAFKLQNTEFTGSYTRNTEQSTTSPGLSINSIPTDLVFKQTNDQFEITRTQKYGSGKIETYTEVLKLDGSKTETKIDADTKKISTIQFTNGQDSFIQKSTYMDNNGKITQNKTETWTLSNAGKILTVNVESQSDNDEYSWKGTFDKK